MAKKKNTRRKSKKVVDKTPLFEGFKESISSRYKKIKVSTSTFLKKFKKDNSSKINSIKLFSLIVIGYGLIINFPLHFIFDLKFSLATMLSWGIVYYFIKDEFVEWVRRLIAKRR